LIEFKISAAKRLDPIRYSFNFSTPINFNFPSLSSNVKHHEWGMQKMTNKRDIDSNKKFFIVIFESILANKFIWDKSMVD